MFILSEYKILEKENKKLRKAENSSDSYQSLNILSLQPYIVVTIKVMSYQLLQPLPIQFANRYNCTTN